MIMNEIVLTEKEILELYKIRYLLKQKGYTQRQLSHKYGKSRQYINYVLNGKIYNDKILNDIKKLVDIVT